METFRLIHEFIDGTLESGTEEQLFINLSSNEELRNELKQQMAIKDAIKTDTNAFTTPASSTMKVFAALGFAAPVPVAAPVNPTHIGFWQNLMTYKQALIGGLIACTATAVLFFLFLNNSDNNVSQSSNSVINNIAGNSLYKPEIPKTTSVNTDAIQPVKVKTITKVRYVDVPRYVDTKPAETTVAANTQQNTPQPAIPEYPVYSKLNEANILETSREHALSLHYTPTAHYNNASFPDNLMAFNYEDDALLGWNVEFRGAQQWYTSAPPVGPSSNSPFNKLSFGIFKDISENLSIGLEFRQENFYQDYTGTDDGINYRFQQQPNLASLNVALRYTAPFHYLNFHPFGQLTLGDYNFNTGFIGRGMVGLRYIPYATGINCVIGFEYSTMKYMHQGNSFWTNKFNLNYGIAYNF